MFSWFLVLFLISVCFSSLSYILPNLRFKHQGSPKHFPPCPPKFPILGHLPLLGKLPYRTMHKWSQKYGPIMQLHLGAVPITVVSSAEMAELFLKKHDLNFSNRPKNLVARSTLLGSNGILFQDYGPKLRDARKLCSMHLLSVKKVESTMCLRREEINDFVRNMRNVAERHDVVNISAEVKLLIERITCRMMFGSANKERERLNFKPLVEEGLRLAGGFNINDFLPFMKAIDFQRLTHRARDVVKIMDMHLERIIDQEEEDRRGNQEHHKETTNVIMSLITSCNANEEMIDRNTIKVIILDLLGGSWETSETTIGWALKELQKHPRVMKKVQEELENVVGMGRMVEESDIKKLPYLDMIVKESMRLHPVIPIIPRESAKDVSIQGLHIPNKSRIIINVWAIGRDSKVWSDKVDEFYPERFSNSDIDVRGHYFQLIPFGSGHRQCPGLELGMRTVKVVLAQLLHCFNLELPKEISPEEVNMNEKFGGKDNPLFVSPTYRLRV